MSFWKTYTILPPKPKLFLIFYGKSTPATDSNWRAPGLRLVLAANTAHVLRLNKADVLALNKAHVLRLNNKIFCFSTDIVLLNNTQTCWKLARKDESHPRKC